MKQLKEQKQPVVPKFVADFYESIKDNFEWNLFNNQDMPEVSEWLNCDMDKTVDTLVKMKLYGYEIKKLYTVEIPNPNYIDEYLRVYLCKDANNNNKVRLCFWDHYISLDVSDAWKQAINAQLTEEEIKEDFEWAWQFAEEVK